MAATPALLETFLADYARLVETTLKPGQAAIVAELASWQDPAHWEKYKRTSRMPLPTPVHSILSRIKRPEQVVDKILRRPDTFPAGLAAESLARMHDTLGFRVVVYFLSHLPLIDRELRDCGAFELSASDPPVAYLSADQVRVLGLDHLEQREKESGYSSVHYTVRLRRPPAPWFELQVQTLAQETWSAIEHHLGYKPGKCISLAAQAQFKILSKYISAIDEHFNLLHEELNHLQEEVSYNQDDFLNAENLPSVLADMGVSCAQRDLNNILKFLYSRGVERVADLRALGTAKRLATIRNTYLATAGRLPVSLEVIATLAALRGAASAREEVERIKAQIAYRGAWDTIRHDLMRA